jgi:hypothetical protein
VQARLAILAGLAFVVGACSPAPEATTSPVTRSSPEPAALAPSPTAPFEAAASPGAIGDIPPRCPPRPFDPEASLGPEFDEEFLAEERTDALAEGLMAGLATIYADPAADVCRWFTDQGWASALKHDPILGAVGRGESIIAQDHLVRIAFQREYDLRERPPVVPLDIIFDVPAGAATTDLASGETTATVTTAREGVHADFLFDGHRWRVDRLGPLDDEFAEFTRLPSAPPPGTPCQGFVRDPGRAPFDEDADRPWCDEAGLGRSISRDQLRMSTRYPCGEGRAAILHVGQPLGTVRDRLLRWDYVRDPADAFLELGWVAERYDGHASLPRDAADTGWTNGNVDLWIRPSELDRAVYLVRGEHVERWPRANEWWGVIDCN